MYFCQCRAFAKGHRRIRRPRSFVVLLKLHIQNTPTSWGDEFWAMAPSEPQTEECLLPYRCQLYYSGCPTKPASSSSLRTRARPASSPFDDAFFFLKKIFATAVTLYFEIPKDVQSVKLDCSRLGEAWSSTRKSHAFGRDSTQSWLYLPAKYAPCGCYSAGVDSFRLEASSNYEYCCC
jgi:hypothetical protein